MDKLDVLDDVIRDGMKVELFLKDGLIACRISFIYPVWEGEIVTADTTREALIKAMNLAIEKTEAEVRKIESKGV